MTDEGSDLPRYTWTESGLVVSVFRRAGLYGQEHLFTLAVPASKLGTGPGRDAGRLLPEVANALCEYLDRRDGDRE